MIIYHIIAMVAGVVLDLIIGDPYSLPHPIRLIGKLIESLDKRMLPKDLSGIKRDAEKERASGRRIVAAVLISVFVATAAVIVCAYIINPWVGCAAEAILTAYILAAKSLSKESLKVYKKLMSGTLEEARASVAMIVGRDTDALDSAGVCRAAVETVAENTGDGVIAPYLYTAIGGPILGMIYKSVNTMDSMIGYKNERYTDLGRAAAKLDDVANFIPARISAGLLIFAAFFKEHIGAKANRALYSAKRAIKIFKRDRFNHKSPNSAQTESAVAGALGLKLAGDASYFGKIVKKPTIGDEIRAIEPEDIRRTIGLMYVAYIAAVCCLTAIWLGIYFLCR